MAKAQLTTASGGVYVGSTYSGRGYALEGRRGVKMATLVKYSFGTPAVADVDGVAAAQAVAGAGNLTLNGALASGGVVTFDTPRAVEIDSSNAGDTTQTATVTGTDYHGNAMVEVLTFNGLNAVSGAKAFYTVTQVAISAALTGNATCGSTDILGLPYAVSDLSDLLFVMADGVDEKATSTIVLADATAATGTTGDVRGTINPNTTLNGSVEFVAWMHVPTPDNSALGVAQFAG